MVAHGRGRGKTLLDSEDGLSSVAVDLLRILKTRYNYRKLSVMTGVPVSTLTRYLTGKTVPKGAKVRKLLRNLMANINISSLVAQSMRGNGEEVDLTPVMLDPNMVKVLGAHVINEFAGAKVTSFLALDTLSVPLTTYLAVSTSRPFHIVSSEPLAANGEAIPIIFNEPRSVWVKSYWLLLRLGRRKESILVISSKTPEPRFFNLLSDTLEKRGSEITGFFSVLANEEYMKKLNIRPGCKRSYILVE